MRTLFPIAVVLLAACETRKGPPAPRLSPEVELGELVLGPEVEPAPPTYEARIYADRIAAASNGTEHLVMWNLGGQLGAVRVPLAGPPLDIPPRLVETPTSGDTPVSLVRAGGHYALFSSTGNGLRYRLLADDGSPLTAGDWGLTLGDHTLSSSEVYAVELAGKLAVLWSPLPPFPRLTVIDLATGQIIGTTLLTAGAPLSLVQDGNGFVALIADFSLPQVVAKVQRVSSAAVASTPVTVATGGEVRRLVAANGELWLISSRPVPLSSLVELVAGQLLPDAGVTSLTLATSPASPVGASSLEAAGVGSRIVVAELLSRAPPNTFARTVTLDVASRVVTPLEELNLGGLHSAPVLSCASIGCLMACPGLTGGARISPAGGFVDSEELAIGRAPAVTTSVAAAASTFDFAVLVRQSLKTRVMFLDRDGAPKGPLIDVLGNWPNASIAVSQDDYFLSWVESLTLFGAPLHRDGGLGDAGSLGLFVYDGEVEGASWGYAAITGDGTGYQHVLLLGRDGAIRHDVPLPTSTWNPPERAVATSPDGVFASWRSGNQSSDSVFISVDGGQTAVLRLPAGRVQLDVGDAWLYSTPSGHLFLSRDGGSRGPFNSGNIRSTSFDGTQVLATQTNGPALQRLQLGGAVQRTLEPELGAGVTNIATASHDGRTVVLWNRFDPALGVARAYSRVVDWTVRSLGARCDLPSDCASGFCADRVCCDTACRNSSPYDCRACSIDAGAAVDGTCGPIAAGTLCPLSFSECEQPIRCDGVSLDCPPAELKDAGTVCRSSPNPCVRASVCNGVSGVCPSLVARAEGEACDDGQACTLGETCQLGLCRAASVLDAGTACDDGRVCTVSTACAPDGGCVGTPLVCPSAPSQCVESRCEEPAGCTLTPRTNQPCDDHDGCTLGDRCAASGACVPATVKNCGLPDTPCERDVVCNPATGLCEVAFVADGVACDDSDACTSESRCLDGSCRSSVAVVCELDAGPCKQAFGCDARSGQCVVVTLPDFSPCDDGNPCTGPDQCFVGGCLGGAIACPAVDACHAGECNPATGQCEPVDVPDGTECNDGRVCTTNDHCTAGVCGGDALCVPSECQRQVRCPDCVFASLPNGSPCSTGTCEDGVCRRQGCGCSSGAEATLLLLALLFVRRRGAAPSRP